MGWLKAQGFVDTQFVTYITIFCDLTISAIHSGCSSTEDKACSTVTFAMFIIIGIGYLVVCGVIVGVTCFKPAACINWDQTGFRVLMHRLIGTRDRMQCGGLRDKMQAMVKNMSEMVRSEANSRITQISKTNSPEGEVKVLVCEMTLLVGQLDSLVGLETDTMKTLMSTMEFLVNRMEAKSDKMKSLVGGKREWIQFIYCLLPVLAGFLYYFGDNLGRIMNKHGSTVGCTDNCVTTVQVASFSSLYVAGLVYLTTRSEHIYDKFTRLRISARPPDHIGRDRPGPPTWYTICKHTLPVLLFIHILPKVDIIYTAITYAAGLDNRHWTEFDRHYCTVSWLFLTSVVVLIYVQIFLILLHHWSCANISCKATKFWQLVSALIVSLTTAAYLLVDNVIPLNCATADVETVAIIQVATFGIVAIVLSGIIVIECVLLCCHKEPANPINRGIQ